MANLSNINNKFLVTTGGNVGINTTSPAEKLEVSGGHIKIINSGNTNLYINANNSGSDSTIFFQETNSTKAKIQHDASNDSMLFTDGAYTDTMTLKGGKVGIGTASPSEKLHVVDTSAGVVRAPLRLQNEGTTAGTGVELYLTTKTSSGGNTTSIVRSVSTDTSGNCDMVLLTPYQGSASEKMRITSTGTVGIGTASPSAGVPLTVYYNSTSQFHIGGAQAGISNNVYYNGSAYVNRNTSTGGALLQLGTDGSFAFRRATSGSSPTLNYSQYIGANGNVGIGTTSPDEKLDITGGYLKFNGGDYGLKGSASLSYNPVSDHYFQSSGSTKVTFKASGNVGIGTTSPDRSLDVEGNGMAIFGTGGYSELMLRGQVEGTGTVRNVGAWHWSVRGDVGGDNDDLKLLRFNTGSYAGTAMVVRSDNGGIAIGQNNSGYSSQILSVKSETGDTVFYGESTDANCFASFRDNSSTANIEYGAIGNAHVFRKDANEYMRIASNGRVGIGTTAPVALLHLKQAAGANIRFENGTTNRVCTVGEGVGTNDVFSFRGNSYRSTDTLSVVFSTDRVGIGIITPNEKLQVAGNIHAYAPSGIDAGLFASTAAGNTTAAVRSSGVTHFNGGNVGIGTTSPTSPANVAKFLEIQGSTAGIVLHDDGNDPYEIWASGGNLVFRYNNTDGANGMLLSSTGDLGIGTTSPGAKLEVRHATYANTNETATFINGNQPVRVAYDTMVVAQTDVPCLSIIETVGDSTQATEQKLTFAVGDNAAIIGSSSTVANGIYINTNRPTNVAGYLTGQGTNVARFLNNGYAIFPVRVGIGTTSPSYSLDVKGPDTNNAVIARFYSNTGARGSFIIRNGSGTNPTTFIGTAGGSEQLSIGTNNTEALRIDASQKVGIGTDSPTYKLHVASSNNVSIFEDTSNASGAAFIVFNRPSVFSMGSITRNGSANSVSYNTGSDYRLKEDLKDFNALDLVNNITAYDYKWKDVEQRDYGFIAHELKQTLPNVVTGEKDGEKMQGVDYSKLTPILLKAIQELEARVKELENK